MDIVGRREPTFRHILKDLHQLNSEGGYPAGHVGVGLLADVVVKAVKGFNLPFLTHGGPRLRVCPPLLFTLFLLISYRVLY